MLFALIIFVLIIVALIWLGGFYNRMKTMQVHIKASIQEIGNQLKRQAELIPNLVEAVKGYKEHEKGVYDQLTQAREAISQAANQNDAGKIDESQKLLNKVLGSIRVIVESNPQLQTATLVNKLLDELRDTSDKVMYARRTLIDLSADYNTAITTIPGVWLAPIFHFESAKGLETPAGDFLKVDESETKTPKVNL